MINYIVKQLLSKNITKHLKKKKKRFYDPRIPRRGFIRLQYYNGNTLTNGVSHYLTRAIKKRIDDEEYNSVDYDGVPLLIYKDNDFDGTDYDCIIQILADGAFSSPDAEAGAKKEIDRFIVALSQLYKEKKKKSKTGKRGICLKGFRERI